MSQNMDMYESEEVECAECGAVFDIADHQYHECDIAGASKQNIYTATQKTSEDTNVAKFAEAIQARPALWDHTLPLKERGKDIREHFWREVYEEMDGLIPLNQMEKKWKNLKDTFLKHLKTYKPSGAGADEKKKWKHYDSLSFLTDINLNRVTFGNFAPVEAAVNVDLLSPTSSTSRSLLSNSDTPSRIKRQKKSDETDQMLLEVLKQPTPKKENLTTISPVLMAVQEVLNKLPENVRMKAEIDILNKVYQLHAENQVL
ncbi:unnamed protein product [Psylliodes chrysocephalus]|uniref:MADF domain-containing protein n=1 Tax=Psylliodes chrysocephalus TaxID=3402493 RepID=A0A9P0CK72_9CUCU|nr:unnamed protein product [Psylliodes chrysocephala]